MSALTSGFALRSTAFLLAVTIISKLIGFAREVILLESIGIGGELDMFLVLYGIVTLANGALGICVVTSIAPVAREYRGREGALLLLRGSLIPAVVAWALATGAAMTYAGIVSAQGMPGMLLAAIISAVVPFALVAEYQVGLFLSRGWRAPVISGNIIISLPLALTLLLFDLSIIDYSAGLVLSFALRVAIFAWLLVRQGKSVDASLPERPPQLFGSRLIPTLAGGSAMLAMTVIYVTVTMTAHQFGEGTATLVGFGLKLPLLVLTSIWFVLGTGFFSAILREAEGNAVRRIFRLTCLNLGFFVAAVALVLAIRSPLPGMLGWPGDSEMLVVLRESLPYLPLILLVPTVEMVQRLFVTRERPLQVSLIALPVLLIGLGLQAIGILLENVALTVASPSCAALGGFLMAVFLIRRRTRAAAGIVE